MSSLGCPLELAAAHSTHSTAQHSTTHSQTEALSGDADENENENESVSRRQLGPTRNPRKSNLDQQDGEVQHGRTVPKVRE